MIRRLILLASGQDARFQAAATKGYFTVVAQGACSRVPSLWIVRFGKV
ncbi:hypothetical protein [Paenibacillus silviterrae]|nr:hypothetical protein [Paenibacillus chinjuensis]